VKSTIFPSGEREAWSSTLRIAAMSRDAELADIARDALRHLGKPPTMPKAPRRAKAIRKGRRS
jgi:hypothetical protein